MEERQLSVPRLLCHGVVVEETSTMCKWTPRIDVTWVELAVSKVVIGDGVSGYSIKRMTCLKCDRSIGFLVLARNRINFMQEGGSPLVFQKRKGVIVGTVPSRKHNEEAQVKYTVCKGNQATRSGYEPEWTLYFICSVTYGRRPTLKPRDVPSAMYVQAGLER